MGKMPMSAAPEPQARETIDARLAAAGWRRGRQIPLGQSPFPTKANTGPILPSAAGRGSKAFTPRSLAEPTRIMANAARRLSVVEELEAMVTTNLQRATRLRQAVLQKAFTGKLES